MMPADVDPPTDDRFLRSLWRLVRWALPGRFKFFGIYEYRIVKAYPGGTSLTIALELQATEDTIDAGLDDIPKVQPWNGLAGSVPAATPGARVLISFIGGNAARPFVVAWAPNGDAGWLPASLSIDAVGTVSIGSGASSVILANATPVSTNTATAAAERRVVCYGDPVVVGTASGPMTLAIGQACSKVRA